MRSCFTRRARHLTIALLVLATAALLPTSAFAHFEGSMTKTVDRATASPGDVVTFTLTVTSQISIPTHPNGTVTDSLPAGLTFVSATGGCTNVGQDVTCSFAPPAVGQSISFTVLARIDATAAPGQLCNTSVMHHPSDTTPGDNSSTTCLTVVPPPVVTPPVVTPPPPPAVETVTPPAPVTTTPPAGGSSPPAINQNTRLTIVKTVTPGQALAGSRVIYVIVVKNIGSVAAKNVQVCDTLPDGVTVPSTAGGRLRNGQICWTITTLAAGKTITYRLTAVIDLDRSGSIVNSVCAKGGNTMKVCAKVPVSVTRAAPPRSDVAGVTG